MAMNEVDTKHLGRLAKEAQSYSPVLSSALFKILGLSVLLSRRLVRARQVRKLDPTRDSKSLALYHHIIWLSREGLNLTESYVLPFAEQRGANAQLKVFAAKLQASFYHVFCLFHNTPPVQSFSGQTGTGVSGYSRGPLSPKQDNGQRTQRSSEGAPAGSTAEMERVSANDKENVQRLMPTDQAPSQRRQAALRETIPSMASEASNVTNPYINTISPPPGLKPLPSIAPNPAFLLPAMNYVPPAQTAFVRAVKLSQSLLPGSSPLRLSIALEYCAFLWDCLHDYDGCRRMARRTIQDVYRAEEGMDDADFEDAKMLVGTLGRMMRRQPSDATPKLGEEMPPSAQDVGVNVSIPPVPDIQMSGTGTDRPSAINNPTSATAASPTRRAAAAGASSTSSRRGGNGSSTTPKGSPNRTTTPKGTPPRSPRSRGGNGKKSSERVASSPPKNSPSRITKK